MGIYKVLIDTNIYDGSNYSFGNAQFSTIQRFAEQGYLSLLINSVIQGEVENHIRGRLKKATQDINDKLSDLSMPFASFRCDEPYKSHLTPFDKDDMIRICLERFHNFLGNCHVETFSANGINVESMVEDYFSASAPFQDSKPDEFKDAITIRSFVKYLSDLEQMNGLKDDIFCVVAADKGFRKGLSRLIPERCSVNIYHRLDEFISVIAALDKRVQALTEYLDTEFDEDEIKDAILPFIENVSYQVDDFTDEFELLDVDNVCFHLLWTDIISDHKAKATFDVEAVIKIWYSYTDEDRSCFDKEDWVYLWKTEVEKNETHKINFEITLDIDLADFGMHADDSENKAGEYVFNFEDDCITVIGIAEKPHSINLDEDTCQECEVTESDPFNDDAGEREFALDTCPDCGCPIGLENDGGNGFCVSCAPNH